MFAPTYLLAVFQACGSCRATAIRDNFGSLVVAELVGVAGLGLRGGLGRDRVEFVEECPEHRGREGQLSRRPGSEQVDQLAALVARPELERLEQGAQQQVEPDAELAQRLEARRKRPVLQPADGVG